MLAFTVAPSLAGSVETWTGLELGLGRNWSPQASEVLGIPATLDLEVRNPPRSDGAWGGVVVFDLWYLMYEVEDLVIVCKLLSAGLF